MKIYRAYYQQRSGDGAGGLAEDGDDGRTVKWFASRRAARQCVADARRTGNAADTGPTGVDVYDVPLSRAGFLAFLNAYFTTDNG